MFGPQARAAELQAMRSAAMRQRSHDVEERVLTPAAVSLSDFARGQQLSRNKGNKQYKPLTLEDIESPCSATPASPLAATPSSSHSIASAAPNARGQTPEYHRGMPDPPSGPALMRSTHSPQPQLFGSYYYHNPGRSQMARPPTMQASMQTPLQRTFNPGDFVFGLNGYSPVKPELHLEHLRSHQSGTPRRDTLTSWQETQYMRLSRPYHQQQPTGLFSNMLTPSQHGLDMLHPYSDHPDLSYFKPHFERSSTFANDILHHENQLQDAGKEESQPHEEVYDRHSKMQSFVAAQQAMARIGKTVLRNPQLGTANAYSQLYKNGQNNASGTPSHRENEKSTDLSPAHDPFSSGYTPKPRQIDIVDYPNLNQSAVSEVSPSKNRRQLEDCKAIWRAIQRRDNQTPRTPPRAAIRIEAITDMESKVLGPTPYSTIPFPVDDNTSTEEWCRLRPLTTDDRQKIKSIISALSIDPPLPIRGDRIVRGKGTTEHETPIKRPASVPKPVNLKKEEDDDITIDVAVESGSSSIKADNASPGDHIVALRTPRSATLLNDNRTLASPPARIARDPRYRPMSAQALAMRESLRLW